MEHDRNSSGQTVEETTGIQDSETPKPKLTVLQVAITAIVVGALACTVFALVTPTYDRGKNPRRQAAMASLNTIDMALQVFEKKVGRFPTTDEGLKALVERPGTVPEDRWPGRLLKEFPMDPWRQPFLYRCPGRIGGAYDLVCVGKDKAEGTPDDIALPRRPQDADPPI
jgi:general secretion pathway protein G